MTNLTDHNNDRIMYLIVNSLISIISAFIVSWTPYFVVFYAHVYAGYGGHPSITVVLLVYYINAITNPVLFFIYHYRKPRRMSDSSNHRSMTLCTFVSTNDKSTTDVSINSTRHGVPLLATNSKCWFVNFIITYCYVLADTSEAVMSFNKTLSSQTCTSSVTVAYSDISF